VGGEKHQLMELKTKNRKIRFKPIREWEESWAGSRRSRCVAIGCGVQGIWGTLFWWRKPKLKQKNRGCKDVAKLTAGGKGEGLQKETIRRRRKQGRLR